MEELSTPRETSSTTTKQTTSSNNRLIFRNANIFSVFNDSKCSTCHTLDDEYSCFFNKFSAFIKLRGICILESQLTALRDNIKNTQMVDFSKVFSYKSCIDEYLQNEILNSFLVNFYKSHLQFASKYPKCQKINILRDIYQNI